MKRILIIGPSVILLLTAIPAQAAPNPNCTQRSTYSSVCQSPGNTEVVNTPWQPLNQIQQQDWWMGGSLLFHH
jgi:hypothetical protein